MCQAYRAASNFFTNASLRLLPSIMDFLRTVRKAHPYSDEGDVVFAYSINSYLRHFRSV